MDVDRTRGTTPLHINTENDYHIKSTKTDPVLEEHVSWKDIRPQILACNVGYLFTIHAGINLAFSNLLLEEFDLATSSWCASIVGLSTPFGACLTGAFVDKIGRKPANMLIAVPCVLGWSLTFVVGNDQRWLLYAARFFSGVAGGMCVSNMVYVSEISHKKYRSVMQSLLSVYFSVGILITTILKLVFSWRQSALCFSVFFSLVLVLVALYTSETPIWLANFQNDWDGAKKSLRKLYANPKVFENEWRHLMHSRRSSTSPSALRILKFTNPIIYRPMSRLFVLFLLQQLSGIYLAIMYAITFFPAVSPNLGKDMKNGSFVLFGVMRLLTSTAGSLISIYIDRRSLLLFSSIGMGLSCVLIVASVAGYESLTTFWDMMAVIAFVSYIGAGSFGVMTVPWTLIFELLPTEVRSKGGTIVLAFGYALISVCAKMFPYLLEATSAWWVFSFFAFISFSLAIFVYMCIPETLGKTFREIEQYFE